ncbi:hypothetical protein TPELB_14090 [Terrisporobacter petrolearius]|uniref:ParB/Sulfiredoxin domain-containing protein n=1 Tax=Terrisporobacter petrolearius TaxID=1460447 RepID=A0ABZ3FDQ1_9FIRM
MSKKNKTKSKATVHDEIKFPEPYIRGEPFWAIMEYNTNNKIRILSYEGIDVLFLNERSAKFFKNLLKLDNNNVIRGIYKDLLHMLTKDSKKLFLIPLCDAQSDKIQMIKVTSDEIRYYAENSKFEDETIQNIITVYYEIIDEAISTHKRIIFDEVFKAVNDINIKCNYKFKNLENLFEEYRKVILKDCDNQVNEINERDKAMNDKSQLFIYPFSIGDFGLELGWDIDKIKNIIKDYNIPIAKVKVKDIVDEADFREIVEDYDTLNKEPIIIASIEHIPNYNIVIDGSHRLYKKYKNNEEDINAYVLEPKYHIEGMYLNIYKDIYKVANNIVNIQSYILGDIKKEDFKLYEIK